jgi:hypothetical protein
MVQSLVWLPPLTLENSPLAVLPTVRADATVVNQTLQTFGRAAKPGAVIECRL